MPQPCYCGPATVPIVCVERIIELVKARDLSTGALLEISGHVGAVWAYVAAKLGGGQLLNATQDDEKLNASVMRLVDALAGVKESKVPVAVPGFIINLIISQVLAALLEQIKDGEFWEKLMEQLKDLFDKKVA